MPLRESIVAQFKQPSGLAGHWAGWIMASRSSNRARNRWTVELLRLEADSNVLEIGCGPGIALDTCLPVLHSGDAVGIDHSDTMIAQAKRHLRRFVDNGVLTLHSGGLEVLPTLGRTFDRVFSVNVVQFLPDVETAFSQQFAITKPGGFVATTYMPRHRKPTRDDALHMAEVIESAMERSGFVDIRTEELPIRPVPAVCIIGQRPKVKSI